MLQLAAILEITAFSVFTLVILYLSSRVSRTERVLASSPTIKAEYANKKLKEAQELIAKAGDK